MTKSSLGNPMARQVYVALVGIIVISLDSFVPLLRGHPVALWDLYMAVAITLGDITTILLAYTLCLIALLFFVPFFPALPVESLAFSVATLLIGYAVRQRHKTEAALSHTHETLRRVAFELQQAVAREKVVLDNSPNSIISIDLSGRVTSFNRTAELLFGWSETEVIGQDIALFIIPERYRERHYAGLKRVAQTGDAPIENMRLHTVALRRDKTEFPIELILRRIPLQQDAVFTAFIRDTTRPSVALE